MSVKKRQHTAFDSDASCIIKEAHPALKRLKLTDTVQVYENQQYFQQHSQATQPAHAGTVEAPCQHNTFYPMNAVLKQLHMERVQRQQLDQQAQQQLIGGSHAMGQPR